MKRFLLASCLIMALLLFAGCDAEQTATQSVTQSTESALTSDISMAENTNSRSNVTNTDTQLKEHEFASEASMTEDTNSSSDAAATDIIIDINGTEVHATLNHSKIAQEFKTLLPFSITVSRAADDLCGSVSEELTYDESENESGWKVGQIAWFGGWFTILMDNEADFASMLVPVLGSINDEDLAYVQGLTGAIDITVRNADEDSTDTDEEVTMIYAYIGENTLEITPADNSSAKAFVELLEQEDVTVEMHDYGGFEKVGGLLTSLPTNDESITTEPGDVILYQGNSIVIYYDTNTWSFTRLGKVQGLSQEELKTVLGEGNVTVTFSLD